MTSIFQICLEYILKVEGGYTDHPLDRGGPTNFGITLQTLADYNGLPSTPVSAIKELTQEQASKIYELKYWNTMRLDRVHSKKVCMILFDQGVIAGPVTAIKMLQEVLNECFQEELEIDGVLGNHTDVAIATANETRLCRKLIQKALRRYVSLCEKNPGQLVFLKGWMNRTFALQEAVV